MVSGRHCSGDRQSRDQECPAIFDRNRRKKSGQNEQIPEQLGGEPDPAQRRHGEMHGSERKADHQHPVVKIGELDHVELSEPREEHRGERDVDRADHESEKDVAESDAEDGYEWHQKHSRERGPVKVEAVMGQHQIVGDLGYHTKMELAMHERVRQIVEICMLGDVEKG